MDNAHNMPAAPASNPWMLSPGRPHVWIWQVASTSLDPAELNTLDSRERQRALRFRPTLHRAHWVRSHTGMRQILAGYLHCSPAQVRFRRGPNGKPLLHAPHPPAFNLSHTQDWCALAVAPNPNIEINLGIGIGIDIQAPHPINPALWRRVLTPLETSQITALDPTQQDAAFFRCWTRKEAIGKADSQGVYVHLKRTETGLLPQSKGTAILTAENPSGIPTPWHVTDLRLPAGLFGAIATAAPAIPDLRTPQQAGLNF